MSEKIKELQKRITPILEKNDVKRASVFGSFARGDDNEGSDVDLLIELKEPKGLLFLSALKHKLEEASEKKIDLLTYRSINPLLEKYIYEDEIKIYG